MRAISVQRKGFEKIHLKGKQQARALCKHDWNAQSALIALFFRLIHETDKRSHRVKEKLHELITQQ